MRVSRFVVAIFLLTSVHSRGQSDTAWFPMSKWSISSVQCLSEQDRVALARRLETGDADAQDVLGNQHISGCQSPNDPVKGLELLSRAAAQGNAHAQLSLGEIYQIGRLVKKSIPVAITWFEKSAGQGNAGAQNDLGIFYLYGDNVVKDEQRAAELFKAAAEQDRPEAAYNLATLYDEGKGVAQDYRTARRWYQQAAERKDADAEYRLALLLERGLGGEADPVAAMRWLRRAAEDGSQDAQLKLGLKLPSEAQTLSSGYFQYQIARAFFEGKGAAKDPATALQFLEKSAAAGYPPAFLALGRMYARGDGVAKDEAKAVGYFEQAIAHDTRNGMAYNSLAWTLITAENPKLRDPGRALELANKAVELADGKEAYQLDTLAHVYFALGNFSEARKIEAKALALQPESDSYQKSLEEFKKFKDQPTAK